MAVVTTYVCDVTGKSGTDMADFVKVNLSATTYYAIGNGSPHTSNYPPMKIDKLIHKDVADKLNLRVIGKDDVEQPEVSFEGKLKALLTDFIDNIVADSVSEHMSNYSR